MNKWIIIFFYKLWKDILCWIRRFWLRKKKLIKLKIIRDLDIRKCYKKYWNGDIYLKF